MHEIPHPNNIRTKTRQKVSTSAVPTDFLFQRLRAATNESQKTRNKNQETKRFNTFAVSRLRHSVTKKHCLIRESSFQRNMCETANQQSISSHMVVYMACKMRCR